MNSYLPIPSGAVIALTASQTPAPLAPAAIEGAGSGSYGPFNQGMTAGVSVALNQACSKIRTLARAGAGGLGVLSGLDIAAGTGLTVSVSAGAASAGDIISFAGSTLPIPASSNSWIWLTSGGVLAFSASAGAVPTDGVCFLGSVTASSASVTGIDYSGRVFIQDGMRIRQTADPFAPGDLLSPAARVVTITQNGSYWWNGLEHVPMTALGRHQTSSFNRHILAADLTLTGQSPNMQWLTASGASRQVTLPEAASMADGGWFEVVNAGDASVPSQNYSVEVHSPSGGSPLVTLAPGHSAQFRIQPPSSGGSPSWPASVPAVMGL